MQANIALIGRNTLMLYGLKQMLEEIMPLAQFSIHYSLENMQRSLAGFPVFHYFVSVAIFAENPNFFAQHPRQTIILQDESTSPPPVLHRPEGNIMTYPSGGVHETRLPTINMLQPREQILKQLLRFQQMGHRNNANYPTQLTQHLKQAQEQEEKLTQRETEVLRLLASGNINKEIADQLNISINTVITHRKHIMQKLHSQSLSKLAIYAVQHRIIDVDDVN